MTKPRMLLIPERPIRLPYDVHEWVKEPCFRMAGFDLVGIFPYQYIARDKGRVVMNQELIQLAKECRPDFIHFEKCPSIESETLKEITAILPNVTIIMWYGDVRSLGIIEDWLIKRLPYVNIMLMTASDKRLMDMYLRHWKIIGAKGRREAHEWQNAAPDNYYWYNWTHIHPTYDVHFGGNNYRGFWPLSPFRESLIRAIDARFELHVQGGNWQFAKHHTVGMIDHDIYPEVIIQSLTTLGVNNIDGIAHYYNKRLFQCMATGRFHITKYVVGMERDFEKGIHCDWFNTIEEAVEMLAFYLQDREATRKRGIAGAILLGKEHGWLARAKQYRKIVLGEDSKEDK